MKPYYSLALMILLFSHCDQKLESDNIALSSDGVEISYEKHGTGETALIFVHGWSNTRNIWDDQLEYFSNNYTAIGVDLAGFGKSGNNRQNWTISAFGDDVVAVIRELNLKRVVLVGFSMGGPVIVEVARKVPDKIIGLVLVDTMKDIEKKISDEEMAYIESAFMDIVTNPAPEKLEGIFYKKNKEIAFARVEKMLSGPSHTGWLESLKENGRWLNEDCISSLKLVNAPIVAINSDMEPSNVEAFSGISPTFKAHIMNDVGHLIFWDDPEQFNQLLSLSVEEFLEIH